VKCFGKLQTRNAMQIASFWICLYFEGRESGREHPTEQQHKNIIIKSHTHTHTHSVQKKNYIMFILIMSK